MAVVAVGLVLCDWRCSGQVRSSQGSFGPCPLRVLYSSTMEPSAPSGGVAVSASAGRNELQNQNQVKSGRARKARQGRQATPESPEEQTENK